MPQVRIPNASLIVRAESPLLPFLVPRIFPAFYSSRSRNQQNGRSYKTSKEEETAASFKGNLMCKDIIHIVQPNARNNKFAPHEPHRANIPTLSLSHSPRTKENSAKRGSRTYQLYRLYSNISFICRQHLRSYSTTQPAARKKGRMVARVPRPVIRRVAGKVKIKKRKSRSTQPAQKASTLSQRGSMLMAKRKNAFALERSRLSNYISRLPLGLVEVDKMKKGQYRSLVRRVVNLKNWKAIRLDLSGDLDRTRKSSSLIRGFASLDRAIYPSFRRFTRNIRIKHDAHCVRLSAKLFSPPETSLEEIQRNWMALDVETRKTWFARLLLYLLDRKSGRALQFMQVLAMDQRLRRLRAEAIADGLGHLSKIHRKGAYLTTHSWDENAEANKSAFLPGFVHVFQTALAKRRDVCSQDLLYNLVGLASMEDLKKVFDCLMEARTRVGFETFLHYANAFGKAGEFQYALRCLDELKARYSTAAWQGVVDRERLRWSCALILRKSMSESQSYHETPRIVAFMVGLGIKMDMLLYNVVMHNAMEAGDYTTAFKVFHTLEGNSLKPDKRTFSILLHGCTLQGNPAMFQDFAQNCAEMAKTLNDPWLATDVLYYLYVRHEHSTDAEYRSGLLWQTYLTFFSATSLEPFVGANRIELRYAIENQPPIAGSALFEPTPVALYIMLQTEIRLALAISNQRVLSLYQKFQSLATSSSLWPLARTPTIWNAFLLAFCQKEQYANASQLIKDMTETSPQPNIYSWNIFMQAFFKTGQAQAGERIFEIMRNRGLEPDQYSYGLLLRGYAKAQLIERIGRTMLYVDAEHELNPDLLRSLTKVLNRKELMVTLEKSRIEKQAIAKERMERDIKEERERWGMSRFPSKGESASAKAKFEENKPAELVAMEMQLSQDSPIVSKATGSISPDPTADFQESVAENQWSLATGERKLSSPERPQAYPLEPLNTSQDGSAGSQKLSNSAHAVQETVDVSLSRSTLRPSNFNDPEIQYQRLQERLGLIPPNPHLHSFGEETSEEVNSFGANLGFKSMLPENHQKTRVVWQKWRSEKANAQPTSKLRHGQSLVKGSKDAKVRPSRTLPSDSLPEKSGKHD